MPREPSAESFQLSLPSESVAFDPDAFDELLRTQGVPMVHWRAMRCPVGMVDPDDIRRPHDHHADCSNGFLYTRAGTVYVGFLGNSKESRFIDPGRLDGSTVQVVLSRYYEDPEGQRVQVCQFDRMYLVDDVAPVPNWHTFAANQTGVDRLQFPAVHVEDLVDADNARYREGVDFEVRQGQIHWLGQRRPGVDPKSGKGKVCSVRYTYRPFWYVKSMAHEVRVAQVEDQDTGDRSLVRMPQAATLQREYHFEKEQRDPLAPHPDSQRQHPAPPGGGFGSR